MSVIATTHVSIRFRKLHIFVSAARRGFLSHEPGHPDPRVLTADDQPIVLCGHARATRRGKELDTDEVHVLSLRDGKIRELWIFHQNQNHVDEFWR